jgi:Ca-activated chloride channel family protein
MSFIWPAMLGLLVVVPVLVAGYVALVQRRNARAADLAARGFVPTAARRRRARHVPFAFFVAALVFMLVAFARPEMSFGLPHREGTVVLAFDVSNSMRATDLAPTRLDAAKADARAFVERQPSSIKIGVVAFGDGGLVTQAPTSARADVVAAIDRLTPQGSTSVGQGIFTALSAIAGKPIAVDPRAIDNPDSIDIGYYGSATVLLLSDGESTSGPDPVAVARLAAVAGVKVNTIGIGSPEGTTIEIGGFSVATALDADTLQQIATSTGGTYYAAADSEALSDIYRHIKLAVTTDPKKTEVTALATAISIAMLVVGGALSLVWFGRLV